MSIDRLVQQHQLQGCHLSSGETVIPGRYGFIMEESSHELRLILSPKRWATYRQALSAVGMQVELAKRTSVAALFDSRNHSQLWVAAKAAGLEPARRR